MEQNKTVYVIGAGVSGLIAAYELEQAGYRPVVLEKSGEVGGRIKTVDMNGVALDLGFQVLLSAYPMAKHYLDMEALHLRKLESGALIYAGGKHYRIGDPLRDLSVLFPTLLADIGSMGDKFKILKLNRKLKAKSLDAIFASPETTTLEYLQDFGFSSKIIERFFRPFFAGIFLEPDLCTSSRMFEFVYKMFGEGYATIPQDGIGAISAQLKDKLKQTEFRFNCAVQQVTQNSIMLESGEELSHDGVIVASNTPSALLGETDHKVRWKSCMCLYFAVDQTNIPGETIALIADRSKLSNNLYAYMDAASGKTILSATVLDYKGRSDEEVTAAVTSEIKSFTGALQVEHLHSFRIDQALPDITNLSKTAHPSDHRPYDNVFLAGDYLLNSSLNAAMESGRIAAKGLIGELKS